MKYACLLTTVIVNGTRVYLYSRQIQGKPSVFDTRWTLSKQQTGELKWYIIFVLKMNEFIQIFKFNKAIRVLKIDSLQRAVTFSEIQKTIYSLAD